MELFHSYVEAAKILHPVRPQATVGTCLCVSQIQIHTSFRYSDI